MGANLATTPVNIWWVGHGALKIKQLSSQLILICSYRFGQSASILPTENFEKMFCNNHESVIYQIPPLITSITIND